MSFVGGKLKLKGGSDLPGVKKKKKSKEAKAKELALAASGSAEGENGDSKANGDSKDDMRRVLEGYAVEAPAEGVDRRTEVRPPLHVTMHMQCPLCDQVAKCHDRLCP